MPFIGNKPTAVPLTSADLTDNIITSAKIADGTIVGDDINSTFDLTGKTVTGAGGGKVLQVVSATDSTQRATSDGGGSGTGWVTASNTLSVTITPTSASNKIILMCSTMAYTTWNNGDFNLTFFRDSTNLASGGIVSLKQQYTTSYNTEALGLTPIWYDSPSSTSAITYQLYLRGYGICYVNYNGNTGSIIAMEIQG